MISCFYGYGVEVDGINSCIGKYVLLNGCFVYCYNVIVIVGEFYM